jgi:CBS domain-containing protein
MLIQRILSTKGGEVLTVTSATSISDAVAILSEHRIGALVVSDDGGESAGGILSERDIVRALATDGADVLARTVADLMTTEVYTCGPDATAEDLMGLMTEHRIRHIPVLADGKLAGIVSIGDVVKHRLGELETETQALHDYIATGR